jgi:hypothetical protein
MRSAVLKRDKGICALCGTDTIALRAEYDKLSREWRRAGHVREFYSVAEHSVRVSLACPPEHAAWGLLHDASEAYLVDLPRPLKRFSEMGRLYMEAEARVMKAVCERFGLSSEQPEIVGKLDTVLLMTEKRDLMCAEPKPWEDTEAPLDEIIRPWNPQRAALEFLHRYAELGLTERTTEGECEVSQTAHERPEEPRLKKVGP